MASYQNPHKNSPRISVIIYAYNHEKYIAECIESILNQTLQPAEIVICDDYSADRTWEVIERFYSKNPGLIRHFRHEKNMGMHYNSNFAIEKSTGELLSCIDGDDIWMPEKLEKEWHALQRMPDAKIAYSNVITIDPEGKDTGIWYDGNGPQPPSGDVFPQVFAKRFFPNNTSIFRNHLTYRAAYDAVGHHDPNIPVHIDWDLKIRLTSRFKVAYSGEALVKYRVHDAGIHETHRHHLMESEKTVINKNRYLIETRSEEEKQYILDGLSKLTSHHHTDKKITPKDSSGNNLIFLISLPRSGSTMLQRILGSHSQIHTVSEPWIMLHPLYALKRQGIQSEFEWTLSRNAMDDLLKQFPEGEEVYIRALQAMADVVYSRLRELSGKPLFLDKTPRYYFIIPELARVFPEARFIFLQRNPLAVFSSILKSWFGNNPVQLKNSYNYTDLTKGPRLILEGMQELGHRAFRVKYEDLVSQPGREIRQLCDRLNIPFEDEMLNYNERCQLTGRYGDQLKVNQYARPVDENADTWIENLTTDKARFEAALNFLNETGDGLWSKLGYSAGQVRLVLEEKSLQKINSEGSDQIIQAVNRLREDGKLSEAAVLVEKSLQKSPQDLALLNMKGELLIESGELEASRIHFENVLQKFPQDLSAKNDLVVIHIMQAQFTEALVLLKDILEHDPENDTALQNFEYLKSVNKAVTVDDTALTRETESLSNPKFSVITPSFNQAMFIEQAVQSVMAQSYTDFEHIVIDGASSDHTVEILKKYPHLKWTSEKDNGQTEAINKGFRQAKGDIIALLNSDDLYTPEAFRIVAEYFDAHPEVKAVIGDCLFMYPDSTRNFRVRNRNLTFEDILQYWDMWIPPTQPSIFFKRDLLDEFGLWDETLHRAMDYEYWLRISGKYPLHYIPELLSVYRFHESSKSGLGDTWEPFYPEWHEVYLNYKSNSQRLPQQILVTAVFVFDSSRSGDKEYLNQFRNAVIRQGRQRLRDMEILILTMSQETETVLALPQLPLSVRIIHIKSLEESELEEVILKNSRGFAVHRLYIALPVPDFWYHHALNLLLDKGLSEYKDSKMGKKEKSGDQIKSRFGPDRLVCLADRVKISVIVPTYNRSDILKLNLEALQKQTYPSRNFEVFVCDDGSTDNTREVVENFKSSFRLTYLRQENSGPAAARNMGIRQAKGELLLILNDDAIIEPDVLELHEETHHQHADEKISVLGSFSVMPQWQGEPFGYLLQNSDMVFWFNKMKADQKYDFNHFWTCNLSIPRQAVLDAGLFDEDFRGPAAEDIELGYRLQKMGYNVLYKPHIRSWHHHRQSPESFGRMHEVRGKWAVLLMLKHPELPFYPGICHAEIEKWRLEIQDQAGKIREANQRIIELESAWQNEAKSERLLEYVREELPLMRNLHHYYDKKGILSSPYLEELLALREKRHTDRQKKVWAILEKQAALISVVIPCYNYGRYLRETVESVLAQTYRFYEIIIVNDGSTDDTNQVAENLISENPGKVIRLIDQNNSGQPAISRNLGIAAANGQYIMPLDGDDKIHPEMLEKCIKVLTFYPDVSIAYTDRQDFDGTDQVVQAGNFNFDKLKYANQISHCALFKKEVWEKVGGYRTNVRGVEDWDFWIAAGALGYKGLRITEPLFYYRRHDTGVYQDALKNKEVKFAHIILNNAKLYSLEEVARARKYLELAAKGNGTGLSLVSVIIPTYNRPDQLKNAVQSVLDQIYPNVEIIVVNDAGTPVGGVLKKMDYQKNIQYIEHKTNKGLAAARNTGIKAAKGKYIALLDDDDIFYPLHLATAVDILVNQDHQAVYTDAVRASFRKSGENYLVSDFTIPYSIDFDRHKLLLGNISPVNCFVFERQSAVEAGLFDETFSTLEDWEFWIRLSRTAVFHHIPKPTVQVNWRTDGTTMTSARSAEFKANRQRIYSKYMDEIREITNVPEIMEEFKRIWSKDSRASGSQPSILKDEPLVSIVMLTFNALEYTKKCLASISAHTPENHEIIFVDNGSSDGTVEFLKGLMAENSHYLLIENVANRGFSAGNNQGAAAARGKFLLLLNNDVLVADGWLSGLIRSLDASNRIGAVGPITNSISGLQRVATVPYTNESGFPAFAAEVLRLNKGKLTPRRRIAGFAMLMRKTVYDELGGLDESFGNGNFEDDDFCLRLRGKGYALMVDESIYIHHFGSQTFKANQMDYKMSLDEKGKQFRGKWPHVDYEELLEMKNPLSEVHLQKISLAENYLAGSGWQAARDLYDEVLSDNPLNVEALFGAAISSRQLLEFKEAHSYLNRLLKLEPDQAEAWNQLGLVYLALQDQFRAADAFLTAVKSDPAHQDAWRNYADALIKTGREEDGMAILHKFLEKFPEDVPALLYMAYHYFECGAYQESRAYLERLEAFASDYPAINQLRQLLDHSNETDVTGTAMAEASLEISESEKEGFDRLRQANRLLQDDNPDQAREAYLELLKSEPQNLLALYGLGLTYQTQEKFAEATRIFKNILDQDDRFAPACTSLGVIAVVRDNYKEAVHWFRQSLRIEPEQPEIKRFLAEALIESGAHHKGVRIIFSLLEENPDDLETLLLAAKVYRDAGRPEEAQPYYERILQIEPDNQQAKKSLHAPVMHSQTVMLSE